MESPSSDQRLWSSLRSRVEAILDDPRRQKLTTCWPSSSASNTPTPSSYHPLLPPASTHPSSFQCAAESVSGKRLREDSLLLMRGFDSVSSSLAQLTGILNAASQEARELAEPSLAAVLRRGREAAEEGREGGEPKRKRLCPSNLAEGEPEEKKRKKEEEEDADTGEDDERKDNKGKESGTDGKLEKAKKMAISMVTKATSLAWELKKIKEELGFMQERCSQLEEENRRLREGLEGGLRPEEDDLVRLQLETLLAEKSRLANENATLTRENQCLHQLVEYHQLTSQELSECYEEVIQGICLDFSPFADGLNDHDSSKMSCAEDSEAPCTPKALDNDFSPAEV